MDKTIWKQLYITSPHDPGKSICSLLERAADQIEELDNKQRLHVSEIYLKQDLSDPEDNPVLFMQYWHMGSEDIEGENEAQSLASTERISAFLPEVTYLLDFGDKPIPLNCLIVRQPQGNDQGNVPALLRRASNELKAIDNLEVLDITYHEITDDDALDHPVLHIYFKSKFS